MGPAPQVILCPSQTCRLAVASITVSWQPNMSWLNENYQEDFPFLIMNMQEDCFSAERAELAESVLSSREASLLRNC